MKNKDFKYHSTTLGTVLFVFIISFMFEIWGIYNITTQHDVGLSIITMIMLAVPFIYSLILLLIMWKRKKKYIDF